MSTRTRNFKNFWNDFSESRVALISFFIFIVILFIAVFAPLVSPTDPYDLSTVSIMNSRLPPMSEDFAGNLYILGTDGAGRDMLSSLFYGLRISLGVGVFSGIVALVIGSSLGISAAFFRGKYEMFVMRIVDIQLSFPSILVALIILASFGKGVEKTIIALILVQWAYYARTARGTALVEMNKEYVDSDFTWKNFTIEEQNQILKSERSNNLLDATCLEQLFPEIKNIKESVIYIFKNYNK